MSQHPRHFELRQKRALNELEQCKVPGCLSRRATLSHYCSRHWQAMRRKGAPTANTVRPRDIKPHLTTVRRLFAAQPSHAGLVAARAFVADVIRRGLAGDSSAPGCGPGRIDGRDHYRRLHEHGVTAQEVLEEVCAVYLLSQSRPQFLPDGPQLDYCMAKRVLTLAPLPRALSAGGHARPKLPPPRMLRELGSYLRSALSPFLVSVQQAVEAMPKARESFIEQLRTPFEMPSVEQAEPIDRTPLPFKQRQ